MEQANASSSMFVINVDDIVNKFMKMCRICFGTTNLKSLHKTKFQNTGLNIVLEKCTSIIVGVDDLLPSNICTECISKLVHADVFRSKCINANNTLTKLLVLTKSDKKTTLANHDKFILNGHNSDEFSCKECKETFYSSELLEQHINNEHRLLKNVSVLNIEKKATEITPATVPLEPDVATKHPTNESKMLPFSPKLVNKKSHICEYCDRRCKNETSLKKHINVVHLKIKNRKYNYLCAICGKSFYNKTKLDTHQVVHTNNREFQCSICPKRFTIKYNLLRHERTHTDVRPFICEYCAASFTQKTNLQTHYAVHKKYPANKCRYCRKIFNNELLIKEHIKHAHSGKQSCNNKKYRKICAVCGVQKQSLKALKEHMGIHTGETKYACPQCGKIFCYAATLKSHMTSHDVLKFECHICKKILKTQNCLKMHLLIHKGLKPHSCKECGMRFRQVSHLNYHKLLHTGTKNHICPHCNRAFALKGNLTVHIRTHTGETPYVCDVCNKGCYDSSSLKRHKRTQHGIAPTKNINKCTTETVSL